MCLCKCLEERGLGGLIKRQTLLKATESRKLRRAMVAHVLKPGCGQKLPFDNEELRVAGEFYLKTNTLLFSFARYHPAFVLYVKVKKMQKWKFHDLTDQQLELHFACSFKKLSFS